MAKNTLIALLFLCLVASLVFGLFKASRIDSVTRESVEAIKQRDEARAAEYRAQEALKLTRDTLEKAYLVATNAKRDAAIAHLETWKAKKQYESIHFRAYNDRQRDSVWTALYPAGDSIR